MSLLSNQSLYNKYRPQSYSAVINQDHVVNTLKAIVHKKSYDFNRNYLFHSSIGGVGKTTLANIFAKAINCLNEQGGEPCNVCPNCKAFDAKSYSDVIYIDGAEYNKVEKVKPIVEIAKQYPINKNGMKIIIIDEVQRMSPEAMSEFLALFEFSFNKTIFLLTTTDASKVSQPIRTRCFQMELHSVSMTQIAGELEKIAIAENIEYSHNDLMKLADKSDGSLREAIQTMSQYNEAYGNIVDLPITFMYDEFNNLVNLCMEGDIVSIQNKLTQIPMGNIYNTFSKYLFQRYLKTNCNKLIDSFLKYTPNDYNSMLLYFIQVNEELLTETSPKIINPLDEAPKKVYVPNPVKKFVDNSAFFARIGFKKEG